MNRIRYIVSSICAGIAISVGCIAYLTSGSAWAFPIGLFTVCAFGLNLFTGNVCFAKLKDIPNLLICLVFNILSAFGTGFIVGYCKPALVENAKNMIIIKYTEGYLSLVALAILCNMLIFVAVGLYHSENLLSVVRLFGLYFATAIFVLCGFEHCIANAFYFGLARDISMQSMTYLIINIVFNAVGGILAYRLTAFIQKEEIKNEVTE